MFITQDTANGFVNSLNIEYAEDRGATCRLVHCSKLMALLHLEVE